MFQDIVGKSLGVKQIRDLRQCHKDEKGNRTYRNIRNRWVKNARDRALSIENGVRVVEFSS